LVVIVLFFLVGGALLWNFQFRTATETPAPVTVASKTASTDMPTRNKVDAQYPEEETKKSTPDLASTAESRKEISTSTSDGLGIIKGTIKMNDGAAIPNDLVLVLHYIPDDARYNPSVDTVYGFREMNGQKGFEFAGLPYGEYVLFGESTSHTGTRNARATEESDTVEWDISLYPSSFISGTVVNTSGEPVPNARVFVAGYLSGGNDLSADIYRSRASAVPTDDHGAFIMNTLQDRAPPLQYRLVAAASGYAAAITGLLPTESTNVQIVLTKGSSISGTVVNQDSGLPMPRKLLTATPQGANVASKETVTDEAGAFTLNDVSPGTLQFTMELENDVLTPETTTLQLADGEDVEDLIINVRTGGIVSGRIYDQDTGNGIGNVKMSAYPQGASNRGYGEAKSDSSGNYVIQGLSPGEYLIIYDPEKGYSRNKSWDNPKNVRAVLGERISGMDFALSKGLSISGKVVVPDGTDVSNLHVTGYAEKSNTTDSTRFEANGSFALYGYEPDTTVNVRVQGGAFAHVPIDISIGNQSLTGIELQVVPEAKITGVVVDHLGNPAQGITLYIRPHSDKSIYSRETSNTSGEISLDGLIPDTYDVKLGVHEYMTDDSDPILETVTLSIGQHSQGHRFRLKEGRARNLMISGTITDDTGAPVAGVKAQIGDPRFSMGNNWAAATNSDGVYELKNMPEGSYSIKFTSPKLVDGWISSVQPGTRNADLTMTRVGIISGQVLAPDGRPLKDFNMLLANGRFIRQGFGAQEKTFKRYHHEEGRFTVEGADPNGMPTLHVRAEGMANAVVPVNRVQSGAARQNVIVQMAAENTLTGQVVDSAGNPVENASVFQGLFSDGQPAQQHAQKKTTDADGRFEIGNLVRGNVMISAVKKGYTPGSRTVNITQPVTNLKLILTNAGSLASRVTMDGEPIEDARVSGSVGSEGAGGIGFEGKTDVDGFFEFAGLPAGPGRIRASVRVGKEYREQNKKFELFSDMETAVNFDFNSATATLEGYLKINESEGAKGSVTARVDAGSFRTSKYADTDDDGHFVIENLPPGRLSLRGRLLDTRGEKIVTGQLTTNETLHLDVPMFGGKTIYVTIANGPAHYQTGGHLMPANFEAPASIEIGFEEDHLFDSALANAQEVDGEMTFQRVDPGSYTVVILGYPKDLDPQVMPKLTVASARVTVTENGDAHVTVSF
jgi:hypothetical protein